MSVSARGTVVSASPWKIITGADGTTLPAVLASTAAFHAGSSIGFFAPACSGVRSIEPTHSVATSASAACPSALATASRDSSG